MAGSKPAALPLGDTPANLPPHRPYSISMQRRAIHSAGHEAAPCDPARAPRCRSASAALANAANTHDPRPRQPRRREAPQPLQRRADLRVARAHHRLEVVPATPFEKAAYCDEGRISCQFRGLEYFARCPPRPRDAAGQTSAPAAPRASAAPRAPRPRPMSPRTKTGTSAPSSAPSSASSRQVQSAPPKPIQRHQRPSPHPNCPRPGRRRSGMRLRTRSAAPRGAAGRLQRARRAHHQSASGATSAGPAMRSIRPSSRGAMPIRRTGR